MFHIRNNVFLEYCFLIFLFLVIRLRTTSAIRILPSSRKNQNNNSHSTDELRHRILAELQEVKVDKPTSPDEHVVTSLPLLDPNEYTTKHWAGHLPVSDDGDKYFFYWLFEPDNSNSIIQNDAEIPLIIWLNGGPACSSMDGLFIENGPLRLTVNEQTGEFQVTAAPYSWHKTPAYTLYIDQPVGTGLSWTTSRKYPTNDNEINIDFYYFLQEFFQLHADKFVTDGVMNRKLFFSGESYAGHYIPSMMNYILKQKDSGLSKPIEISVRGGAIGNGWTDPFYQYAGAQFAYGHGLLGFPEVIAFAEKEKLCQEQLNKGNYNVGICFDLIDDIIDQSHGGKAPTKVSGYDVRIAENKAGTRKFPPGHKVIETYLGGHMLPSDEGGTLSSDIYHQVLEAIHATSAEEAGQRYYECTDPPYNALAGNDGLGVVDDVVDILKHPDDVQLLFFNGIHDIICNHVGNERFLEKLPWEGAAEWTQSERYAWVASSDTDSGQVSGYMKEYRNLKFLKVMDAGHMVPMDVPNIAQDMMQTFIYGGSFNEYIQKLSKATEKNECPVCPTCLERDSSFHDEEDMLPDGNNPDENVDKNDTLGTFVISYAWLVAGIVVVVFVLVLTIIRKRNTSSALQRSSIVPQYELELRNGVYQDEPEDESEARVI